ncbi:phospho-2-dehydro-3-deoxyheptonate aldolase [Bryobacterales bacterium F-183]|nr:phospho-2-dehydro-3-deoxyheptonate aldolase [Bryobacterales bacterium F-183]
MTKDWARNSWRLKPATQQPNYPDPDALSAAIRKLSALPPLVTAWEIGSLQKQLAEAAAGNRFVLQGGDCAERFDDCTTVSITNKLKILLQMSLVLINGGKKPVTRVGRFAGQYAKPRSEDLETRNGVALPSYRGDVVNRPEFTAEARIPDPSRMVLGYERAALTLNFLRAMVRGGFADLHHPEYWDLDFVDHSPLAAEYRDMVRSIADSLRFMESVLGVHTGEMNWVDFFTAHEGLLLPYEEAQTHFMGLQNKWYNLSTHFPWIGARTLNPDGAHIEYFRGIANPIGIKVGPSLSEDHLKRLLDTLHPDNEPGRLTIIHRVGRAKIESALPGIIKAVRQSGKQVLWICDPMHGNTHPTSEGIKTRDFRDIFGELELSFEIHKACGTHLGGVHIELTGENVTECVGGARNLTEQDLKRAYKSEVDPRLNYEQALEIAMLIAKKMSSL